MAALIAENGNLAKEIEMGPGWKPEQEAVAGMIRPCLKDRWWAAWERALIWDKLIELGYLNRWQVGQLLQ